MGGGSSGQGMQTSGGMTVYNNLGYDPSQPQGGPAPWQYILAGLGDTSKGIGKGIASGTTPPPSPDTPSLSPAETYPTQQTNPTIPQNNLIEALLRLIGGG